MPYAVYWGIIVINSLGSGGRKTTTKPHWTQEDISMSELHMSATVPRASNFPGIRLAVQQAKCSEPVMVRQKPWKAGDIDYQ